MKILKGIKPYFIAMCVYFTVSVIVMEMMFNVTNIILVGSRFPIIYQFLFINLMIASFQFIIDRLGIKNILAKIIMMIIAVFLSVYISMPIFSFGGPTIFVLFGLSEIIISIIVFILLAVISESIIFAKNKSDGAKINAKLKERNESK
jgi:uncharacterized protein YacL